MNTHTNVSAATPPLEADAFAHVDHWVFDLDNTLYSHESQVWPQVNQRITLFLQELFGLDGLSSHALRNYYYHRYGTTLNGLMVEHGVEPTTSSTSLMTSISVCWSPIRRWARRLPHCPGAS